VYAPAPTSIKPPSPLRATQRKSAISFFFLRLVSTQRPRRDRGSRERRATPLAPPAHNADMAPSAWAVAHAALCIVALAPPAAGFYLPGVAPNDFEKVRVRQPPLCLTSPPLLPPSWLEISSLPLCVFGDRARFGSAVGRPRSANARAGRIEIWLHVFATILALRAVGGPENVSVLSRAKSCICVSPLHVLRVRFSSRVDA
jgi:hypothetical protein